MIFEEGTEIVISNKKIGIIKSNGPIDEENNYLVEIGKELKKVYAKNIVSSEEWSTSKLLSIHGPSIFRKKIMNKETSKLIFFCLFLFALHNTIG